MSNNYIINIESLARGILLGQLSPSDATDQAFITASVRTEITHLFVCNTTGGALTFRLFHDVGGSTYATSNALFYDKNVPANDTIEIISQCLFGGIVLAPTDTLGVRSSVANNLTFTAYGTYETKRH